MELYHHGVKGMKWGVRRYQNKDGTLTSAGKKRMYRELFDMEGSSSKAKKNYHIDANKWVKEDLQRSRNLTESSRNLANDTKKMVDASIKNRKVPKMDLSNMSDQDMRNAINRACLEKQYNDMFNPQKEAKGREFANRILNTAGNVLAITGSALSIALAIKELRG